MSGDESFNFHGIEVTGGQNVVGKNEGGMVQHNAPTELAMPRFIAAVVEDIPQEVAEEIKPLMELLSQLPETEQQAAIETQTPEWRGLVSRITPYAGTIGKNIATFTSAALDVLAKRHPIVAGIHAVCQANSQ